MTADNFCLWRPFLLLGPGNFLLLNLDPWSMRLIKKDQGPWIRIRSRFNPLFGGDVECSVVIGLVPNQNEYFNPN